MRRVLAAAALAAVLGSSGAQAADLPDDQWWSYCIIGVGTGSNQQAFFSRPFRGRVHNTIEDTRPNQSGPMADYDVRERLTRTFKAKGYLTHATGSRCWTMPRRDYLENEMRPDMYDRHQGQPIFEFDLDPMTGAASNITPMANPRQMRAAAPPPSPPSSGSSGLVVTDSQTPAERAERIAREDRQEAMRLAELTRKADEAKALERRRAEEKAAMEAWKRRPKAPPCGGTTGRGCRASRQ